MQCSTTHKLHWFLSCLVSASLGSSVREFSYPQKNRENPRKTSGMERRWEGMGKAWHIFFFFSSLLSARAGLKTRHVCICHKQWLPDAPLRFSCTPPYLLSLFLLIQKECVIYICQCSRTISNFRTNTGSYLLSPGTVAL